MRNLFAISLLLNAALVVGLSPSASHADEAFLLKGLIPGGSSALFKGRLFVSAVLGEFNIWTHGYNLWVTDGTIDGTRLVMGNGSIPVSNIRKGWITVLRDQLFFINGNALWTSDGTSEGTRYLFGFPQDSTTFSGWLPIGGLASTKDHLFFFLRYFDETGRGPLYQLWISDGTLQGTLTLADIENWEGLLESGGAATKERFFFPAFSSGFGHELWASDGTPEGTQMVKDILTGPMSSSPGGFTAVGDKVAFNAGQLWFSDGTPDGTQAMLVDFNIKPGQNNCGARGLCSVGDRVFFISECGEEVEVLWASDGTAEGTGPVIEFSPPQGISPYWLTPVGDRLFFWGNDGIHGIEPWITDGTLEGTRMIQDLNPGTGSSIPGIDQVLPPVINASLPDGTLVFSVDDRARTAGAPFVNLLWAVHLEASPAEPRFQRGEINGDGAADISDAIGILEFLFLGTSEVSCRDAADVDDSGEVDVTDPIRLLGHLFLGVPEPPPPFRACGADPTWADGLSCVRFPDC
ncbi:MAG: hypothetical protein HY717_11960 [Planctomycetes bacterium]|nr:hypothetical protein [Planctomycetota bacterium]